MFISHLGMECFERKSSWHVKQQIEIIEPLFPLNDTVFLKNMENEYEQKQHTIVNLTEKRVFIIMHP